MAKRCLIYVRASLDQTGEGRSVARQEEACRSLANARGWTVVGVETDNSVSASTGKKRPAWGRVLEQLGADTCDVLVAWHVDRMTRSMLDLEELIAIAEAHEVGIATATGDIDLTSDAGRMVARILAAVARAEVERKADRQRLANAQSAKAGRPWSGGARPFGYTDDQMSLVPAEATAIQQAAEAILSGDSMSAIARRWSEAGLISSRAVQSGAKSGWSSHGVKNVMTSPRYAGIRMYRGEAVGEAQWPAIFDLDTHLALRTHLEGRSASNKAGATASNLLTNIATCQVCGKFVHAASARKRLTYTCSPHGHVHAFRQEADLAVVDYVVAILTTPEVASQFAAEDTGSEMVAEHASLQKRMTILLDAFVEGLVDEDNFRRRTAQLSEKIKVSELAMMTVNTRTLLSGLEVGTEAVAAQWEGLDLARKRSIIALLVDVSFAPRAKGGAEPWDTKRHCLITMKRPRSLAHEAA